MEPELESVDLPKLDALAATISQQDVPKLFVYLQEHPANNLPIVVSDYMSAEGTYITKVNGWIRNKFFSHELVSAQLVLKADEWLSDINMCNREHWCGLSPQTKTGALLRLADIIKSLLDDLSRNYRMKRQEEQRTVGSMRSIHCLEKKRIPRLIPRSDTTFFWGDSNKPLKYENPDPLNGILGDHQDPAVQKLVAQLLEPNFAEEKALFGLWTRIMDLHLGPGQGGRLLVPKSIRRAPLQPAEHNGLRETRLPLLGNLRTPSNSVVQQMKPAANGSILPRRNPAQANSVASLPKNEPNPENTPKSTNEPQSAKESVRQNSPAQHSGPLPNHSPQPNNFIPELSAIATPSYTPGQNVNIPQSNGFPSSNLARPNVKVASQPNGILPPGYPTQMNNFVGPNGMPIPGPPQPGSNNFIPQPASTSSHGPQPNNLVLQPRNTPSLGFPPQGPNFFGPQSNGMPLPAPNGFVPQPNSMYSHPSPPVNFVYQPNGINPPVCPPYPNNAFPPGVTHFTSHPHQPRAMSAHPPPPKTLVWTPNLMPPANPPPSKGARSKSMGSSANQSMGVD